MVRFEEKKFEEVEALPEALPEGVDPESYIIATYYMAWPSALDARWVARILAIEQSTGTWIPVPGEEPEMRKRHVAKVVGVYEAPYHEYEVPSGVTERHYIAQIAFPEENIGEQISMLLTTVVGNISLGGKIKLLDLHFPKKYLDGFGGPKFGIEGVREVLGVSGRPLLNNMIKPCTGFPPEVGARLAYEAAVGGTDIVKDDELLGDRPFNLVEERIVKYMEAIDRANSEKGEKTLYTINITDDLPKVLEKAEKVIELGANAIMVNYLATGIPVLRALAEDPSIRVPILAHMDCAGALYESPWSGISSHLVMGKLPRLAGADMVIYPAPYGKAPFMKERYLQIAHSLTYPFRKIKRAFPMPSGGITPKVVHEITGDLGKDVIIAAGGAIHAHPMGGIAGARAFRQAIEAAVKGIPVSEMAKDHEELKVALESM